MFPQSFLLLSQKHHFLCVKAKLLSLRTWLLQLDFQIIPDNSQVRTPFVNSLKRAKTLLSFLGYYLFPLSANQVTQQGPLSFQKVLNQEEGGTLALRNSGSLNNTCLKCINKTLYIKIWQLESWAWRLPLKFLLWALELRLSVLIFLSQRGSPQGLHWQQDPAQSSCSGYGLSPLPEKRGPMRKCVSTVLLWETPGEGRFPNLH